MRSKPCINVPEDLEFIRATYPTTRDWKIERQIQPRPVTLARVVKDTYEMSHILAYLATKPSVSQPMVNELLMMTRDILDRLRTVVDEMKSKQTNFKES